MPDDHEPIGTLDIQCRTTKPREGRAASSGGGGSSGSWPLVSSGNASVDVGFAGVGLLFFLLSLVAGSGSRARAASIPAADICGDRDVEQAARERAAGVGGTLIAAISCNVYETGNTRTSQCTAEVGRRMEGQSVTDIPPGEVRARFIPAPDKPQTVSMPLGRVQITEEPPRQAMLLGAVAGGCLSGCTRQTIEPRMREAAARAGAPVLSGVSCGPEQGAFICRSKAWLPIERAAPREPGSP